MPNAHRGPNLGLLAVVYTVLFNAGLCAVSAFGGLFGVKPPYWPSPWVPASAIAPWFEAHHAAVLFCTFLQIGSYIPLGIFAASMVSRLRYLGITAAGAYIALFGGLLTVFDGMAAGFTTWAMIHPAVVQNASVATALYYLSFAFGGPGFAIPMGLLLAGICVPAYFRKLLPRWIVVFGLALAAAGEMSWLSLVLPKAIFLIPLVRFPAFIWLIAAGFAMPKGIARANSSAATSSA